MSIQRYTTGSGQVRYRARVKSHGRYVATRVFDRKSDAVAWEQDQTRRLRIGEWTDPRRGRVPLSELAPGWLESRRAVKRRTRESDEASWRLHIAPKFGRHPVASITSAEISAWMGALVAGGRSAATATRILATFRSILAHAVADGRITINPAANVKPPRGGQARREGQALTAQQLADLRAACTTDGADLVLVLGLAGLRWGELAGLRVGDIISVPGPGLRVQRAVLASGERGELFVDSVKSGRARTVPLVAELVPIVERWARDKGPGEWLFHAPKGGPLREGNWKRAVGWTRATAEINVPTLRVHDLRHTAASIWLASGADPKVVQTILGHASATMTMDLYGHLMTDNLWAAAARIGERSGTASAGAGLEDPVEDAQDGRR